MPESDTLRNAALHVANYKCFAEEYQGFDTLLPVNLIIGRNNSGKSALLDLVESAQNPRALQSHGHLGKKPSVRYQSILQEGVLRQFFPDNTAGGYIAGNHWDFAKSYIDCRITFSIDADGRYTWMSSEKAFPPSIPSDLLDRLAKAVGNPFGSRQVRRLAAARDISPEIDSNSLSLAPNGVGATNILQNFINKLGYPSELVEKTILAKLNAIVAPDAEFSRITVQQNPQSSQWEVVLEEHQKGRVALSNSGSGLKTVLLVLCLLHLIPVVEGTLGSPAILALEELENNLHPALLRRLLSYLRVHAIDTNTTIILTSHSSVAIDLFSRDEHAQIVHVTHDRLKTQALRTSTYFANRGICDDLDVRASDLLQANGVVWLEGPSDRIYFNRWIELWSGGNLREGQHYQCLFYGGRLLSHLAATAPRDGEETAVNILRVNRNAICIIDSDKRAASDPINSTKQRLVDEISGVGGYAWVTSGREIENYIPDRTLVDHFSALPSLSLPQFASLVETIAAFDETEAERFRRSKPEFAELIVPLLDRESLDRHLDLHQRLEATCNEIRRWNGF